MAARQRTSAYRTNGSVAYAPAYSGNTVRSPKRGQEQRSLPKRAPRYQEIARPQAQVRQAGQVAPFAIIGFLAVGVFAVLLLLSTLQLHVASDNVVSLRNELSALQTENAALSAEYEQIFDMEHLQAAVGATMIRPTADQITYLDMSQPDSVVVHRAGTGVALVDNTVQGAKSLFSDVLEYFR